jgi:hypothetical protein
MQSPLQQALAVAVVLLNGYSFGANCVERFVNYATWHLIPTDAFKAYHRAQQPKILAFVVGPTVLGLVLQVWLALRLPVGMDQQLVWGMVVASLTGMFSTLVLQLPLHRAFNRSGASPELLRKLLRTDWIRKTADAVRLAATAIVLRQLLILR